MGYRLQNFCVLMPVHDRADLKQTFPKSINSVLGNSVLPKQIIIIIDGKLSWDINTQLDIIPSCIEKTVLQKSKNEGITAALNDGLELCKYEIVARVDADDFCRQERFSIQLQRINEGIDLVGGWIQEIDHAGRNLNVKKTPELHCQIVKFALRRNPFNHMTVMFKRSKVLEVGGYPEVSMKEDYALWVKMLSMQNITCYNVPLILVDATTDQNFFRRRGSLLALSSELQMQVYLVKLLNKSLILSLLDLVIRSLMYVMPIFILEKIYKLFLRK